jgi:competence protein ComFA
MEVENMKQRFAGKLLLRKEIPLHDQTFETLLLQKQFTRHPSIQRTGIKVQCNRCQEQKRLALISCGICSETHLYCRNCIQMGRVMECESLYSWSGEQPQWPQHGQPCTWYGKLTDSQQKAADRVVTAVRWQECELLIWAVCGSGKTEMLFPGITEALRTGKRICIATPRADVVRELLPRLQAAFKKVPVQGLYGGSEENDATAQLLISTTHQLLRFHKAFDVIIIDEVDAFPYHKDASLPFAVHRAKKEKATTIYLTATPREDLRKRIERKKLPHIFVPIRFHGKPLPVPVYKIDFFLQKYLKNDSPPGSLIKWLRKRKNKSRQLLLFVPTIELAEKMKSKLLHVLIKENRIENKRELESVHAEDPDREEKVNLFRNNKIKYLITTTILERGVTFPSVDVAVIDAGHEVFDEAALVQIAGRAGRSPEDPTGEVVFIHSGKTHAMEKAKSSIQKMNRRAGF